MEGMVEVQAVDEVTVSRSLGQRSLALKRLDPIRQQAVCCRLTAGQHIDSGRQRGNSFRSVKGCSSPTAECSI